MTAVHRTMTPQEEAEWRIALTAQPAPPPPWVRDQPDYWKHAKALTRHRQAVGRRTRYIGVKPDLWDRALRAAGVDDPDELVELALRALLRERGEAPRG